MLIVVVVAGRELQHPSNKLPSFLPTIHLEGSQKVAQLRIALHLVSPICASH